MKPVQLKSMVFFALAVLAFGPMSPGPLSGSNDSARPSYAPVLHVPLSVHLGHSGRNPDTWGPILAEINTIWWSQAGICFRMETVLHDDPVESGLDIWFAPYVGDFNGYYRDDDEIWVRDDPELAAARHPARFTAARTAAHELGHALGLGHRQDSDDNLMRSKTLGWQLSRDEVLAARNLAGRLAVREVAAVRCEPLESL